MTESRYVVCGFQVKVSRWGVWNIKEAKWVESKLGNRFIFATRKAAVNKAESLNK